MLRMRWPWAPTASRKVVLIGRSSSPHTRKVMVTAVLKLAKAAWDMPMTSLPTRT